MINKIELELHDDISSAFEKIKEVEGTTIEIEIPEGAVILDNILNLKLLQKEGENLGKSIHFYTTDPAGRTLISMLNGENETADGFVTKTVSMEDFESEDGKFGGKNKGSIKDKLPSVSIPKIGIPSLRLPKFPGLSKGWLIPLVVLLLLGLVGGGGYYALASVPEAEVELTVDSQPLTKSIQITVKEGASTDSKRRLLKGTKKTVTVTETQKIETTGEKEVGEKAEGEVTVFNKTLEDITLNKGEQLVYKDGDDDLFYITTEKVTVPAKTELPPDPAKPGEQTFKLGEAKVDIEAEEIGSDYNIDKGKNLELEDYKTSEISATANTDIDGGSSKTVKVVAEEDLTALKEKLSPVILEKSEDQLSKLNNSTEKLIKGSTAATITKEEYSAEVGDEAEELELTQTASAVGLFYLSDELDNLLDNLMESFIPEGHKLSEKERETNVEILGNSDGTVLSSTEADLQVTLKTFIVWEVNEEKIKNDIKGKSIADAQSILEEVKNVNTVSINVSPSIPLLTRMPLDTEKISLEVKIGE